ncbi:MAG: FecR domain-containing protein [Bryobacteraceae bacterium]
MKIVQGGASVIRNTETIPAREGMHLLVGDSLQTGGDGRLGVILQDGTRLSMGPNTRISIDQFLYEPAQAQFGLVLKLARGVMAYISGKIAQFSPESVRVETPVAVCGLRGTELAVTIE